MADREFDTDSTSWNLWGTADVPPLCLGAVRHAQPRRHVLVTSERRLLTMVADKLLETVPPEDEAFAIGIRCPISLSAFQNPVVASDGHVYEREVLCKHFQANGFFSPLTNEPLFSPSVYQSHQTLENMRWWCEKEVVAAFGWNGPFPGEELFLRFLGLEKKPEPIFATSLLRVRCRLKAPGAPAGPPVFATGTASAAASQHL